MLLLLLLCHPLTNDFVIAPAGVEHEPHAGEHAGEHAHIKNETDQGGLERGVAAALPRAPRGAPFAPHSGARVGLVLRPVPFPHRTTLRRFGLS